MDVAFVAHLTVSIGFLPIGSLLQSLIHICNEVCSMEKLFVLQARNISTMIKRIKLLASLFEWIQESNGSLPRLQSSTSPSFSFEEPKLVSNQFYVLAKELGRAFDILPLSLLKVVLDSRLSFFIGKRKRWSCLLTLKELERREELLVLMGSNSEKKKKIKGSIQGTKPSKEDLKVQSTPSNRYYDHCSSSQSLIPNVLDEFCCPISLDLMKGPIIVVYDHNYD